MACPVHLKSRNMAADGEPNHSAFLADTQMMTETIPLSIKVEPGGQNNHGVKNQKSDTLDNHCSSNSKPDCLKIEYLMRDENESLKCQPIFIKEEQHKTWSEDSRNSTGIKKHLIESDDAGPSSYELKSDDVDLGELKMEEYENISELSIGDGQSEEQNSAKQRKGTHEDKFGVTFDCIKCEKRFSKKQSLYNHIVRSHSDDYEMMKIVPYKIYRCKHCRYFTIISTHFARHMRTHGEKYGKSFDCIICKTEFSSKRTLDRHILTLHNDDGAMMKSVSYKIHRCKQCKYFTVRKFSLTKHMRTHGEKSGVTFDCLKCEKEFSSKISLNNHIVTMHSDDGAMLKSITSKIYCCKHCIYSTAISDNLTKHMRTHGEKFGNTFDCIKCKKEFSIKQCLDNHIATSHSDDGEMMKSITSTIYPCKHCKYVTAIKSNLTKHMRVHGEKTAITFYCIKCKKEFSSKFSLDNHIVRMHSGDCEMMKCVTYNILHCMHCQYFTVKKYELVNHLRTHGKKFEATLDCIKCKKGFSSKQSLDRHIVTLHNDDSEIMKSVTFKIHRCQHCKYFTLKKYRLPKHMRTHEENYLTA